MRLPTIIIFPILLLALCCGIFQELSCKRNNSRGSSDDEKEISVDAEHQNNPGATPTGEPDSKKDSGDSAANEKDTNPPPGEPVVDLPINAGTVISAGTLNSARWTAAGSPYHIKGDIMLPENATLTVDAGVTVIFDGAYKFSVIGGQLLLQGTLEQPIRLTAGLKNPGWYGILFCPDVTCTQSVNKGTLDANYTIFEYARANDQQGDFRYWRRGGALLLLHTASVKISNSVFRYNFSYEVGGALELIAIDNGQTAQLDHILFLGNEAGSGGALRLSHINNRSWTGLIFESNRVRNWPDSYGGAIEAEDVSGITLSNVIAHDNKAEVVGRTDGLGGAFYCYTPSIAFAEPYDLVGNSPEPSTGCGQEAEFMSNQGKKGLVSRTAPNFGSLR